MNKEVLTNLVIEGAYIAARLILEDKIDYRTMFYNRTSLKEMGFSDDEITGLQEATTNVLFDADVNVNVPYNPYLMLALRKATFNLLCGYPVKGGDRIMSQEVATHKLAQEFGITTELPLLISPDTKQPY